MSIQLVNSKRSIKSKHLMRFKLGPVSVETLSLSLSNVIPNHTTQVSKQIVHDIESGAAIADPMRLNRFLCLSFADLKTHTFIYWFGRIALLFFIFILSFFFQQLKLPLCQVRLPRSHERGRSKSAAMRVHRCRAAATRELPRRSEGASHQ